MARVRVIDPTGKAGSIEQAELKVAIETGYRLETDAETRARVLEKHHGGAAGALASGAFGVAKGLTFGASEVLATKTGTVGAWIRDIVDYPIAPDDQAALAEREQSNYEMSKIRMISPKTLAHIKEANQIASVVGEVIGVTAPMLLTGGGAGALRGGAGVASKVATATAGAKWATAATKAAATAAATTSTRSGIAAGLAMTARTGLKGIGSGVLGINAAGEATAAGVARLIGSQAGKGFLRQVAGKAIPRMAGSAVEGAFYGAGQLLSEQALGETELTAERVIAHVGMDALLGMGVGGGIAAVGGGLGILGAKARPLASQITGQLKGITKKIPGLADVYAGTAELLTGKPARAFFGKGMGDVGGAEARRVAMAGQGLRADAARKLAGISDDIRSIFDDVTEQATGKHKAAFMRSIATAQGSADEVTLATRAVVSDVITQMDDAVKAGGGEFGHIRALKDLRRHAKRAVKEIDVAAKSGADDAPGRQFISLDIFKRDMGKLRKKMSRVRSPDSADNTAAEAFEQMFQKTRITLEDAHLFGEVAAGAQREVNKTWTSYLKRLDAYRPKAQFDRAWESVDWKKAYKADPGGYEQYINRIGEAANDLDAQYLASHMRDRQGVLDAIRKNYDLPAGMPAKVDKAATLLDDFNVILGKVERDVNIQNQFKELLKAEAEAGVMSMAGGAMVAGLPGAMAGGTISTLFAPGKMAQRIATFDRATHGIAERVAKLASLERAAGSTAKTITGAVDSLLSGVGRARRVAVPVAVTLSGSKGQTLEEAYLARKKSVDKMASDPQALIEQVDASIGYVQDVAPNITAALASRMTAAAHHLRDTAPVAPAGADATLTPQIKPWAPRPSQIAAWAHRVRAVDDPASIIQDLAQGHVIPEAVDTIRTVYPSLYRDIGVEISGRAAELQKELPRKSRQLLSLWLGVPVDPTMRQPHMQWAQQKYQVQAQAPPQRRGGQKESRRSKDMQTPEERRASR